MLAEQRQAAILRGLDQTGEVSVTSLARTLSVTDETIRRDLAKLADRGRLVRTHGGAIPTELSGETPFALRKSEHATQKQCIARAAAEMVSPGDVIAIDASTTGFELARQLPEAPDDCRITVVSNGLDIARLLANRQGVHVVCTGGEFDAAGSCFVGPLAEGTLRQFAFRHCFVSCRGLDPARGATEASPAHAAVKRQMMAAADKTALLADSSKVGVRSVCFFADTADFATILTDDRVSASFLHDLQESGASVTALDSETTGSCV